MYIIRIKAYGEWEATYAIPTATLNDAYKIAYKAFYANASCSIPDDFESFIKVCEDNESGIYIECIAEDVQLMIGVLTD